MGETLIAGILSFVLILVGLGVGFLLIRILEGSEA